MILVFPIHAVAFIIEVVSVQALTCQQNPIFTPVRSDIQISNQLPTPIQAIIPSMRFGCPSLITGGNIQAVGGSNFDIQVWRPQDTLESLYNLVWRREFRSRTSVRVGNANTLVNSSFAMSPCT